MPTYIPVNPTKYAVSIKVSTTVLTFHGLTIPDVGTLLQLLPTLKAVDYHIPRDFEVIVSLESEEEKDDGKH